MYIVLMNPVSGALRSGELSEKVLEHLRLRGKEYKVVHTSPDADTAALAREALAEKPEALIVCGGDGTLFEVSDAICGAGVPLIIVPSGTGNDFFKMLRLPKDPIKALEVQLNTVPRRIDIGRVNSRHFMNVAGTGFDVQVLRQAEKYKARYRGIVPYFLGLVNALKHYVPVIAELSVDDGPAETVRCAIISIGNGCYIGGGMKAVPTAVIDDGYFDLVCVKPVPLYMILPLIFLYIIGMHTKIGLASVRKCKRVEIKCPGMTVNMDGELKQSDTARFEICEKSVLMNIP